VYKYKLKETNLSHHMTLGDDWGEVISVLEKYGTPDQINDYISHCKKNNIDFEYAQDFIKDFNQWLDSKEIDEMSTSGGAGGYLSKYAFKLPKKQKKIKEDIGATMGPGPKASEEGVKDNYYVKKFKYKLVPKDKNGNYVQKGSGLEVKNF
jgi:hypothetical protein